MAVDLAALATELDTNPAYDADVIGGSNGNLVVLLNAEDVALGRRWRPIPAADFLNAIAGETLTPSQQDQIRTYLALNSSIPVHKPGVGNWIQNQGWAASTITALRDLSEVAGKPADGFLNDDDERITLNDVRTVVRRIAKSHIVSTGQA